jgi:hypothetical protein
MLGYHPLSILPLSDIDYSSVAVVIPTINNSLVVYQPTIIVPIVQESAGGLSAYSLPGTEVVFGPPPAIALTFIHGRHIYSKVKSKNNGILIELTDTNRNLKNSILLKSMNRFQSSKNIELKEINRIPIDIRLQDGKYSIVQE